MPHIYPKNISYQELIKSDTAYRKGIDNTPTDRYIMANLQLLAFTLQTIRNCASRVLGKSTSLIITSGYRSDALNKSVGGVSGSAHGLGLAADFTITGMSIRESIQMVHDELPDLAFNKIIDEFGSWIHLSVSNSQGHTNREFLQAIKENGRTVYKELAFEPKREAV